MLRKRQSYNMSISNSAPYRNVYDFIHIAIYESLEITANNLGCKEQYM